LTVKNIVRLDFHGVTGRSVAENHHSGSFSGGFGRLLTRLMRQVAQLDDSSSAAHRIGFAPLIGITLDVNTNSDRMKSSMPRARHIAMDRI
jgi:hypothetical protein